MKKIALFTDIHGNYEALKSILKDIDKEGVDDIICLGDVIAFGPSSFKCLDTIKKRKIKMVLGNHELYQIRNLSSLSDGCKLQSEIVRKELNDEDIEYLKSLPLKIEMLIYGKLYTFFHYPLKDENLAYPFHSLSLSKSLSFEDTLKDVDSDYTFFGHCHDTFEMNVKHRYYYCLGSSGCVKGNITFYTLLTIEKNMVLLEKRFLTFNRKKFERKFEKYESSNDPCCVDKFFNKEVSSGAVVYRNDKNLEFLIVKHLKGHYSFPKGHLEHLESNEDAAVREIKEETGIDVVLDTNFKEVNTYSKDFRSVKDVTYFIGKAINYDISVQIDEIEKANWLSYNMALDVLTYDNDKEIIKKAYEYLNKNNL